jgi:hypothetical protein
MTSEEICSAADKEDKAAENVEEADKESPIPSFGEAVQRYICSFRLDDDRLA